MARFFILVCFLMSTAATTHNNAKQCTKPHERWSDCYIGECGPISCDNVGKPVACPSIVPPCDGGCVCEEGYVRDKNGTCIDSTECPKQCTKPHERWTDCYLGECVPKTCYDLGMSLPCPGIAAPCAGSCICEEGFLRDDNGNCIDEKDCPSKCSTDPIRIGF